jgi:hypothetical protein
MSNNQEVSSSTEIETDQNLSFVDNHDIIQERNEDSHLDMSAHHAQKPHQKQSSEIVGIEFSGFEISQLMELQERNKTVHDSPQTKTWEGSKEERLETELIVPPSQEDTCLEFKGNNEKEEVVHEGVLSTGLHEDVFQNNKIVDTFDIISNVSFVPNVHQNKVNSFEGSEGKEHMYETSYGTVGSDQEHYGIDKEKLRQHLYSSDQLVFCHIVYDPVVVYMESLFSEVCNLASFGIKGDFSFEYCLPMFFLLQQFYLVCIYSFTCKEENHFVSKLLTWKHWKFSFT